MKLLSTFLLLVTFSLSVIAEDDGYTGLTLDVSVSGFFSPELDSASVTEVNIDSPADKSGIKIGDKLIAIESCKIPGCPARKAEKLINKPKGELIPLTLIRADGSEYSVSLLVE